MYPNTKEIYKTTIDIPYGQLQTMIEWCQHHCESNWHFSVINEAGSENGKYGFSFESEKDYITFLMFKK
jgi:formylmethanofuran dehydrogenase subunit E-like metal-binding protein